MRIHVWTWLWKDTQCRNTIELILPFWTVNFCEFSLFFRGYVHVSHVQSHPGMHASNPGWLWTQPVFEFERVNRYHEYTHVFVEPLWSVYHPRNWNFSFSFRSSTESLTTISITCFLCPSKEGTKSVHGNKICEKFIVIKYNVHTLPNLKKLLSKLA